MDAVAIGVDFGTTNTVVAISGKLGRVDVQRFETPGGLIEAYRSALLFFREGRLPNEKIVHLSGPTALERALDIESDHRYLQSLKTYLGSAAFEDTYLLGRRYLLEELIGLFLGDVLSVEMRGLPIVAGRPVVFAGDRANETLALERLTRAYRNAGAKRIDFAFEPSGAAYWYARDLTRAETVLVADFGGGTSDFSIMRFEPSAGAAFACRYRDCRRYVRFSNRGSRCFAPARQGVPLSIFWQAPAAARALSRDVRPVAQVVTP